MAVRVQMVLLWAVSVGAACGCGLCRDDGRAKELVPGPDGGGSASSAAAEHRQEPGLGGGVWRDRQFRGERTGGAEEF